MRTEAHNSETRSGSQRHLWYGFFAACTAFSLEGFIGWVISSRACYIGHGSLGPFSPEGVRWLLVVITCALFVLVMSAGLVSYRQFREISQSSDPAYSEGTGAHEFIAMMGVFVSAILAVGIVWAGLILIFVDVCMREH